jgi:hypothetical protein
MANDDFKNVVGIDDLDLPIHRTYSKKWLLNLLTTGHDGLRNPSTWDDPFENFFLASGKVAMGGGELADLKSLACDWYGQCWTKHSNTDAMWRIYSADKQGVEARTTVRKLFNNLKKFQSSAWYLQFFIGCVKYVKQDEILDLMNKLSFADVAVGETGLGFVELLCIKREAFMHEAEIRILFQDIDPKKGTKDTLSYPLDANSIFDQLILDPRLTHAEAESLEGDLQHAGCCLPIRRSDLYDAPSFVIRSE